MFGMVLVGALSPKTHFDVSVRKLVLCTALPAELTIVRVPPVGPALKSNPPLEGPPQRTSAPETFAAKGVNVEAVVEKSQIVPGTKEFGLSIINMCVASFHRIVRSGADRLSRVFIAPVDGV